MPLHYDPLVAKLIVWGRDRPEAIRRMTRALAEFGVAGVRTTIPFHAAVMRHPDFLAGRLSTAFIARAFPHGVAASTAAPSRVALIAAALHGYHRTAAAPRRASSAGASAWTLAGRPGTRRFPR